MLCCQGFEVKSYDFTLGRLAYEILRLVQNSGNTLSPGGGENPPFVFQFPAPWSLES